jgi:hypothetical protein
VPPKTVRTQIDTEHWHHGDELNIVEDPRLKRAAPKGVAGASPCRLLQFEKKVTRENTTKLQGKIIRKITMKIKDYYRYQSPMPPHRCEVEIGIYTGL